MQQNGLWSRLFSGLVGNGVGSGISSFYILIVVLGVVGAIIGYLRPAIRDIESYLPDGPVDAEIAETTVTA